MNRWLRRAAILAGIVLVILLLRFTVFRPSPVPVTTFAVERGLVEETVVNSRAGTVESRNRSRMSPAIAGLVVEIPVEKGQKVAEGDVLLRLDDSEHRAQVSLQQRSLEAARAAERQACLKLEQLRRDLRRIEALAQQSLVSDQRLESIRTETEVADAACTAAQAKVEEADAALDVAGANLEKTVMIAPFGGVVLDVTTEVGEWISPSPPGVFIPPVIDLIDPADLYVTAPMDEADAAAIAVGQPVRITLDAFRGREFAGEITYVASYVETKEEQNRTLSVEAVFLESDLPQNLLPGLSADIEVILDRVDDVLRIPSYALLEGEKVLRVENDRLAEVDTRVGLRNWEFAEIRDGLSLGDLVVVSLDRPEIRPGARVEIDSGEGP